MDSLWKNLAMTNQEDPKKVWILIRSDELGADIFGVFSTESAAQSSYAYFNRPSATPRERKIWMNLELQEHEVES